MRHLIINNASDGRRTLRALADDAPGEFGFLELGEGGGAAQIPQVRASCRGTPDGLESIVITAPEFWGSGVAELRRIGARRIALVLDCAHGAGAIADAVESSDIVIVPTRCYAQRLLSGTVAPNTRLKQILVRHSGKVRVLPYGIRAEFTWASGLPVAELRAAKLSARVELSRAIGLRPAPGPLIAVAARLDRQKRLDLSLSAIERAVVEKGAQALVWMIASDPSLRCADFVERFTSFAAACPQDVQLQFLDRSTSASTMCRALSAADFALFPSEPSEPLGIWALEAMACGAVVIGRPVGILHDLRSQVYAQQAAPLLVDGRDEELCDLLTGAVLQACARQAEPPEFDECRIKGVSAAAGLSWRALLPRYLQVLGAAGGNRDAMAG
jgi:glycosyltransferase involved in cell wall biosynthesis